MPGYIQNLEKNPDSGVKVLEKSSTFYSIECLKYRGIIWRLPERKKLKLLRYLGFGSRSSFRKELDTDPHLAEA
jgi:hypothetical protein